MSRTNTEGAASLLAALSLLAISAALAAALADVARVEVVLARHRRVTAAGLAAADACLARILASLPVGWDFAGMLAGPDGISGTPDDGSVVAPPGCTVSAHAAPGPIDPARVRLTLSATTPGGQRTLDAVGGRAPEPGVPALIWLVDAAPLAAIGGAVTFDGTDPLAPTRPPWATLAAPGDPSALDAWLGGQGAHVGVTPATAVPSSVPAPPLSALAARVVAAGPLDAATALVTAGAPPTALALVTGDLVVDVPRSGAGLLLVDGVLDVRADLGYRGVVAATRGIRVASGAHVDVAGALWLGSPAGPGSPFVVDGAAVLRRDVAALTAADALLRLPRRAVLLGMRDVG
jgi:hypothetical protein